MWCQRGIRLQQDVVDANTMTVVRLIDDREVVNSRKSQEFGYRDMIMNGWNGKKLIDTIV